MRTKSRRFNREDSNVARGDAEITFPSNNSAPSELTEIHQGMLQALLPSIQPFRDVAHKFSVMIKRDTDEREDIEK